MKKFYKAISLGLLATLLAGCSCSKEEVNSELTSSHEVISGNKVEHVLTTQEIYEYLRDNDTENVNKYFVTRLIDYILDLEHDSAMASRYNNKIKAYFEEKYLDSDDYKVNGVFNEELLAKYLETQLYKVNRQDNPTSGPTFDLGLAYDYSDYITRGLDYEIGLELLKEDYISNNRKTLLNNSRTRIISIYSSDNLEDMEEVVKKIYNGDYTSLEEIDADKKADEKEEIGRQYCENLGFSNEYYVDEEGNVITTCSASTSSSTYDSALKKFTTCENGVRCLPENGLAYQISLIEDKYRIEEQVINRYTTDILYEDALNQLLRSDVGDYLSGTLVANADPFLINGLYNHDEKVAATDIILSSGPNSTCYLVTVRVVDTNNTSVSDKEKALNLLLEKVSTTTVLSSYFENLKVEIDDPVLNEYFNDIIGK